MKFIHMILYLIVISIQTSEKNMESQQKIG